MMEQNQSMKSDLIQKDNEKVSIVIPNYNGLSFLDPCLASLRQQTFGASHVIVVDNGSMDGSKVFLQENYPEVHVIALNENTGFANAVNEGIRATDSEFIILLNNDTVVDKEFVKVLVESLEENDRYFSAGAKMLSMKQPELMDDGGDYYTALGWAYALGKDKSEKKYDSPRNIFSACAGAAVYRRSILEEIGLFDEHHFAYLEDIDLGYRAKIFGYKNRFEPRAIVYHAGSGSSGSRYNEFKIKLSSKNSTYLIMKNMPLLQILINFPFLIPGFLIKTAFFMKKGFGNLYVSGLFEGIKFSFSKEGKEKKVKFHVKHLSNYGKIQLELWWNILRKAAD